MFSVNLKKKEGRSLYKRELGLKFSEFREGIVLTALNAVKKNAFHTFRDAEEKFMSSSGQVVEELDMKLKKPKIPIWLSKDFITAEHITIATIKNEEINARDNDVKFVSLPKESSIKFNQENQIASQAAIKLYRRVTTKMTAARTIAKQGFFDEIGYLFVNWKSFRCVADQSTVKIQWLNDGSPNKPVEVQTVADSIPSYANNHEGGIDENHITLINRKKQISIV